MYGLLVYNTVPSVIREKWQRYQNKLSHKIRPTILIQKSGSLEFLKHFKHKHRYSRSNTVKSKNNKHDKSLLKEVELRGVYSTTAGLRQYSNVEEESTRNNVL